MLNKLLGNYHFLTILKKIFNLNILIIFIIPGFYYKVVLYGTVSK